MSKTLIRNTNQIKQAIDFIGAEWGSIHPSDIDAVLEFDNEFLILFEVKRVGYPIPGGQKKMLHRICNSWKGKSIVLKAEHEYNDTEIIKLNECELTELYYNGFWRKPKYRLSIEKALELLAKHWNIKKMLK